MYCPICSKQMEKTPELSYECFLCKKCGVEIWRYPKFCGEGSYFFPTDDNGRIISHKTYYLNIEEK